MPLIDTRNLTLYAYNFTNSNVPTIGGYKLDVDQLRFTTLAPGGYGDLSCRIKTNNSRLVPTELSLMSQVALMGGDFAAFLGRWDEPGTTMDQTEGDLFEMTAQGAANVLQDDPDSAAYTNQTGYQIITGEISRRSNYLPLSTDYSLILPDNPTVQLSPVFDGKHLEDVLNEIVPVLGDYQWLVWGHPTARDGASFPTWQLQAHKRDTSTISYLAYPEDRASYHIKPAMEYTYNVVQLLYRDITTNLPSSVTVQDARLNGNGSQGRAPFPRRKLRKDLSAYHLSATQATAIANALLAQYQNGGYKITVELNRVQDGNGSELPLWMVRADGNIALPDLAPIGLQLPISPVPNTNVFYITETEYSESEGQPPQLTITCDSFYDKSSFQVARLQYREEHKIRSAKHRHHVKIPGEQETGVCGAAWGANAVAGDVYETGVNYGKLLTNTPTSITLTVTSSTNNRAVSAVAITNQGFQFEASANANGAGNARCNFTTVGA